MGKRAEEKAELIANGIMISVQGKTGRVVYNTKEKSFTHYELMCAAQKGYEQAEKDLALTWEDVRTILDKENDILHECNDNAQQVIEVYPKGEDYYGEILKRFNEQREKK